LVFQDWMCYISSNKHLAFFSCHPVP
jgi:hypothetical protein